MNLENTDKATVLFNMHIMWYESEMVCETFDSIVKSLEFSKSKVSFKFCLNSQTYLEKPINGKSEDMFSTFLSHAIFSKYNVEIVYKTDKDPFFNVGDWRREEYNNDYKYIVWGESDTLLPTDYFRILDHINITEPHVLTMSSRKMWDDSWFGVEHELFRNMRGDSKTMGILGSGQYISVNQVNLFNSLLPEINIVKLNRTKIDGSLLALSPNLPTPFISPKQHFFGEDTCASGVFTLNGIPQYNVATRIKGHNYNHPRKRVNTDSNRDSDAFMQYSSESRSAMMDFLKNILKEKNEKHKSNNTKS